MIQRKPNNRLGQNGPEEVKNHPWLKDFPWDKLLNKNYEPTFIPNVFYKILVKNKNLFHYQANEDNFDYKAQNSEGRRESNNTEVMQQNAMLLRRNSVQSKRIQ